MRRWAILFLLVSFFQPVRAEAVETAGERTCFGLIWCTEKKEGSVSRDGFLYLYSSEEREGFSRLAIRPLYSHEIDEKADHLRRSILWPLGTYEKRGDDIWFHVFPLYWHEERPRERFTLFLPLYFDYLRDQKSYFHLIPFYGHHARGETYDRYFVLGPVFIYTRDLEQERWRWDFLFSLASHRSGREGEATRVFPFYFSGDDRSGRAYRYFLPVYGTYESPAFEHRFLFPFYGSEEDKQSGERRLSLLGLPPIRALRPLPTLALYEHLSASDRTIDRFFPVYRYAHDQKRDETDFNLLLLYQHRATPQRTDDILFPLGNLSREGEKRDLSLIGYGPLSLIRYINDGTSLTHRFFPLYFYRSRLEGEETFLNVLLLYTHHSSLKELYDVLFPFYSYERQEGKVAFSMVGFSQLSLYRHEESIEKTNDRLLPLYGYESERSDGSWSLRLIGVPPLSLYAHRSTPASVEDRFFPLYRYRREQAGGGWKLTALGLDPILPLHLFAQEKGDRSSRGFLFPLYDYEREEDRFALSFFGIEDLSVYRHQQTPMRMHDRLFPIYDYQRDTAAGSRSFGLMGISPLTLYAHRSTSNEVHDQLFPFYGYRKERSDVAWRLSALGLPPIGQGPALALYEHSASDKEVTDRFIPFYYYRHQLERDEWRFTSLLARYRESPDGKRQSIFPLYSYEQDNKSGLRRLGVIGVAPFSLYQRVRTSEEISDRLFPLYRYRYQRTKDEGELSLLWPLATYKHRDGHTTEASVLWWLMNYERPDEETKNWHILGGSAMAVVKRSVSPERSTFELNPILPLYSYEKEKGKGAGWAFLGGLIGVERSDEGERKVRWLWFFGGAEDRKEKERERT